MGKSNMKGIALVTKRIPLCPQRGHCPKVEITDQEVRIGEKGNLMKLRAAERNVLVQAIKTGDLTGLYGAEG
jgi:hypothetical protein